MATTTTTKSTEQDEHGAILAADATMHLHRFMWQRAIDRAAALGLEFTADDLQAKYDLPDIGNGTGGCFMDAHRQKVIRRVGYRPSGKPSRAGGVVAIWTAGEAA